MKSNNDESEEKEYKFNFDFLIPKILQNNFQQIISFVKRKLEIKSARNINTDNLLKKCKGKFFKIVHKIMSVSLKINVRRLPQTFITNITIEYNQKMFNKNIIDIYHEFNILPDYNTLLQSNIIKKNKLELFKKFCNCSLWNLYQIFIESRRFNNEINIMRLKNGKKYGLLFEFVAMNFCAYYKNHKPHYSKRK